jgi:hypothetical protein
VFKGYVFFIFRYLEGLFVEDIREIFWGDYLGDFLEIFGDMILAFFVGFVI